MKKEKILVVGLGYVGFALATLCANAKKKSKNIYEVYGLEKNSSNGKRILKNLNKNILPFKVEDVFFKNL